MITERLDGYNMWCNNLYVRCARPETLTYMQKYLILRSVFEYYNFKDTVNALKDIDYYVLRHNRAAYQFVLESVIIDLKQEGNY